MVIIFFLTSNIGDDIIIVMPNSVRYYGLILLKSQVKI